MWKPLACLLLMGSTTAYAEDVKRDVWHTANVGPIEIAFQFFSGGRFIERLIDPPAASHGITYYGRYTIDRDILRLSVDAVSAFNFGDTAIPASGYVGNEFIIRLQGGQMLLPFALGVPDADRLERVPVALHSPLQMGVKPKPVVHDAYQPPLPVQEPIVHFLDSQLPAGTRPCVYPCIMKE